MKTIKQSYKVAAVQFEPSLGEVQRNRERLLEKAIEAAEYGAKLIVFPEMATSGYVWENRQEIAPYVETIPGKSTDLLLKVAAKYSCYIVFGLPEIDDQTGSYYNSAVLIGPKGLVGRYRKTHLFAADPRWAREGKEEIPVFQTSIGRIALLICMDAMYFEPTRSAALNGADIVAFPTNWVGTQNNPPSNTWRLRARENGLYWVASNRWGTERGAQFTGGSGIISPTGEVLEQLISGDGIVYGEYQLPNNIKAEILSKRKPQDYHEILLHPYLWKEGETRSVLLTKAFVVNTLAIDSKLSLKESKEQITYYLRTMNTKIKNRLLVLPELSCNNHFELTSFLIEAAQQFDSHIVVTIEDSQKVCFVIGPQGILSHYIQVHSNNAASKGSFLTVQLPFARVGVLTGEDAEFPESYRILSKQGADIIAISANEKTTAEPWMYKIWAYENDALLAVSSPHNSIKSMIFLHSQVFINSKESDSHYLCQNFTIDMFQKVERRPFLSRLNHHLYDRIVELTNMKAGVPS